MESTSLSERIPSRRFHHKSRAGCRQCRGRRTKCDEQKPRCAKCVTRGLVCSLIEESLVIITVRPNGRLASLGIPPRKKVIESREEIVRPSVASTSNTVVESPCLELPTTVPPILRLEGDRTDVMKLMYHYTTCTSRIIANPISVLPLWQDFIPRLAFKHDFLLHGLLAVTALHLNITNPAPEHANAALLHYTEALTLFRPHVGNVTKDNAVAIFALSCLLPLYSFGVKASSLSPINSISEITEVFLLLRGIRSIVTNRNGWLDQSPCKYMLAVVAENYDCPLRQDIEDTLTLLLSRNKMSSEPEYTLFKDAIKVLRETFARAQDPEYNRMVVALFPLKVPERFFETLRERRPMALVILAHYGVILYQLRNEVWFTGWGSRIVDAVTYSLGEEWKDCVTWPIQELEKL